MLSINQFTPLLVVFKNAFSFPAIKPVEELVKNISLNGHVPGAKTLIHVFPPFEVRLILLNPLLLPPTMNPVLSFIKLIELIYVLRFKAVQLMPPFVVLSMISLPPINPFWELIKYVVFSFIVVPEFSSDQKLPPSDVLNIFPLLPVI